jgi:kinesin family protein C1
LKKLENEKENLIEDKTEMREKMDAMEDERRTLHETIQQLKVILTLPGEVTK